MIWDGHICPVPPIDRRRSWWTCDCGQLWRKVDGRWKLTPTEANHA